jgi:putative hydrolase of the HAD superfamily
MVISKVISFDLEGTLVSHDFSSSVWNEGIPRLYSLKKGTSLQESKRHVFKNYEAIGEDNIDWYDIRYWFKNFRLENYKKLLEKYTKQISYFPEVQEVLRNLNKHHLLILATNSSKEFLEFLTPKIKKYIYREFSAPSEYKCLKKNAYFYKKVCNILGISPQSMIHIGDRFEDDFLSPRSIGINAFYLDRLKKSRNDYTVNDLEQFEIEVQKIKKKQ